MLNSIQIEVLKEYFGQTHGNILILEFTHRHCYSWYRIFPKKYEKTQHIVLYSCNSTQDVVFGIENLVFSTPQENISGLEVQKLSG